MAGRLLLSPWASLCREKLQRTVIEAPGLYVLGVKVSAEGEPLPVYVGIATKLRKRLLTYCGNHRRPDALVGDRPVDLALRRIPRDLWFFRVRLSNHPEDEEIELVAAMDAASDHQLLNVYLNTPTKISMARLDRLLAVVRQQVPLLPEIQPYGPASSLVISRATWYRRERARRLHSQGQSVEEVAQALQRDVSTIRRWLSDPPDEELSEIIERD